ncbi:MAG: alkaline phosphatase family protein [Candidatus Brocadiia bacterium]|nr:alkaline phosphatase family protein [Candidatus Brocadiia bacterium]
MGRRILIICVDGMGPDYLEAAATPNMDRMARDGVFSIGRSVVPSVTNVNNVSIITGAPPRVHGITSNYWLDSATGRESYLESPEFLCCPTVLERAREKGMSTALLTSKKKLLRLLDAGADYSLAAEAPSDEMMQRVGPAEDIYSAEVNLWLFRALRSVLRERRPDMVYCATTDWAMHMYAPQEDQSAQHIEGLDRVLGRILDENPDLEIYLTADHGMSQKSRGVDIEKILERRGIRARAIPVIKDRYVAHHQNLGGASYVYLGNPELVPRAMETLQDVPGIEAVYDREAGAEVFDLMAERIGDILALGDKNTVFGSFADAEVRVRVRSHGSRHESAVPIIASGAGKDAHYRKNLDVAAHLFTD